MATTSVPSLVKFAFKDFECFTVDQKLNSHATCSHCKQKITESTSNTTTGFNK